MKKTILILITACTLSTLANAYSSAKPPSTALYDAKFENLTSEDDVKLETIEEVFKYFGSNKKEAVLYIRKHEMNDMLEEYLDEVITR